MRKIGYKKITTVLGPVYDRIRLTKSYYEITLADSTEKDQHRVFNNCLESYGTNGYWKTTYGYFSTFFKVDESSFTSPIKSTGINTNWMMRDLDKLKSLYRVVSKYRMCDNWMEHDPESIKEPISQTLYKIYSGYGFSTMMQFIDYYRLLKRIDNYQNCPEPTGKSSHSPRTKRKKCIVIPQQKIMGDPMLPVITSPNRATNYRHVRMPSFI